jgi:hypothetical protein
MKTWILLLLLVLGALVWFRTSRRWGSEARGNAVALFVFLLMLGGLMAMVFLAARLF